MLPFAPGITGSYVEEKNYLALELKSLRNPQSKVFLIKDKTVVNTVKQDFSPILGDYLGDSVPGFSDTFFEMQSHSVPDAGEEREFEIFSDVKMKFCWIPAGKAILGSPETEYYRSFDEKEHEFETAGFWMGKYPVTQFQWKAVMGKNSSLFKGDNLPVERVNWDDCQDFIEKCDILKLRLPHEDQWEYACRGGKGNKQAFYWGNTLNGNRANCCGSYPYGTDKKGARLRKTTEVGSYEKVAPHPWRLCDMIGNVDEWCENPYTEQSPTDRVIRGGNWESMPQVCRSAYRFWAGMFSRDSHFGFRLIIC